MPTLAELVIDEINRLKPGMARPSRPGEVLQVWFVPVTWSIEVASDWEAYQLGKPLTNRLSEFIRRQVAGVFIARYIGRKVAVGPIKPNPPPPNPLPGDCWTIRLAAQTATFA